MKRIHQLLLIFSLFLIGLILSPTFIFAQQPTCSQTIIETSPLDTNMKWLDATFHIVGLPVGSRHLVRLWRGRNQWKIAQVDDYTCRIPVLNLFCENREAFLEVQAATSQISSDHIRLQRLFGDGVIYQSTPRIDWGTNDYSIELLDGQNRNPILNCKKDFQVTAPVEVSNDCRIRFYPESNIKANTNVSITVSGLSTNNDHLHRVILFRNNSPIDNWCNTKRDLSTNGIQLGTRPDSTYRVEVRSQCGITWTSLYESILCARTYSVDTVNGGRADPGSGGPGPVVSTVYPTPPCRRNLVSAQCDTALGPINVSRPETFITTLFSFILGIGGAATLILLIYAGYIFMTSRGDKQKIAGARETIVSAITGLIFIVLAIAILGFLGASLFDIPGF